MSFRLAVLLFVVEMLDCAELEVIDEFGHLDMACAGWVSVFIMQSRISVKGRAQCDKKSMICNGKQKSFMSSA